MASIAATGGLLFGFDTGVISGAIPYMQSDLNISDSDIEDITTFALIGAMIGALVSGYLSDKFGRKRIILVAAVIFLLGAIGCGSASGVSGLMAARIFLGVGIGVASFSTPLYLAEISPASIRGTLVSMFQLLITVGLLGAFLSDSAIADDTNASCWRNMFYVGVIPAIILLVGMFFLPESPRWLLSKGQEKEALQIMEKIEDHSVIEEEISKMKSDIEQTKEEMTIAETFKQKWMFYPLMLAVLIMFFQQAVGINTVIYYGPSIFQKAGFESGEAALMAQVSVGVVNVI
ncbi:MAG: sugar porter family MFS transporter, partial [Paludibacteraceae bacterium]|nr:sugar porter family MFS transporter [Paludibacteraceae bacterium]